MVQVDHAGARLDAAKEGCLRELPAAAGVLSLPPRKAAKESCPASYHCQKGCPRGAARDSRKTPRIT